MAVRLEFAHLAGDAEVRDNLLSLRGAGITTLQVPEIPAPASVVIAAQLAFTEPDMDQAYKYSVGVVDEAKKAVLSITGEAVPARPEDADLVFPYMFTIIERLDFVAPSAGYYAAVVSLNRKPLKFLPFRVLIPGSV